MTNTNQPCELRNRFAADSVVDGSN